MNKPIIKIKQCISEAKDLALHYSPNEFIATINTDYGDLEIWVKTILPEFSAIYNDNDSGDLATNYRLQVIKAGNDWQSPLWDSGKVTLNPAVAVGARTPDISYSGTPLNLDGSKYYWRIKFWDDDANEGAWTNGSDYFIMAGKQFQSLTYTYDKVGNITRVIDESETSTKKIADYTYDDLYRLTSAAITNSGWINGNYTQTFSYDSLGNFLNKSDAGDYLYQGNQGSSYANPHAVTKINNIDLDYDYNGNLQNVHYNDLVLINANFDYNNRIASTGRPDSSTQTYKYDFSGQRIEQNINNGEKVTVYANKYFEKTVEGGDESETLNIYAHDQLIATAVNKVSGMNLYFVHSDHLNSSSVITNFDSGATVDQVIDYYPFGSIRLNEQNSTQDQVRKFTSHYFDDSTTLQYFGARYYQGDVGRFWSQDPVFINTGDLSSLKIWSVMLTNPQSLNSYSYATNNPLIYIDPLGLWNEKTGAVEKGDTLNKITSQINDIYSTNYTVKNIASLNQIKNPDKIGVGQIIKPNEGTPDVTGKLNTLNEEHAQYAQDKNYGYGNFAWKFREGGKWDLKSQEGTFCTQSSCGGQKYDSYIYNAKEIRYDAPGNIHYGYVGNAIGIGLTTLLAAGDIVQNLSNFSHGQKVPTFDSPIDKMNIMYGYFLFNK